MKVSLRTDDDTVVKFYKTGQITDARLISHAWRYDLKLVSKGMLQILCWLLLNKQKLMQVYLQV